VLGHGCHRSSDTQGQEGVIERQTGIVGEGETTVKEILTLLQVALQRVTVSR